MYMYIAVKYMYYVCKPTYNIIDHVQCSILCIMYVTLPCSSGKTSSSSLHGTVGNSFVSFSFSWTLHTFKQSGHPKHPPQSY